MSQIRVVVSAVAAISFCTVVWLGFAQVDIGDTTCGSLLIPADNRGSECAGKLRPYIVLMLALSSVMIAAVAALRQGRRVGAAALSGANCVLIVTALVITESTRSQGLFGLQVNAGLRFLAL